MLSVWDYFFLLQTLKIKRLFKKLFIEIHETKKELKNVSGIQTSEWMNVNLDSINYTALGNE